MLGGCSSGSEHRLAPFGDCILHPPIVVDSCGPKVVQGSQDVVAPPRGIGEHQHLLVDDLTAVIRTEQPVSGDELPALPLGPPERSEAIGIAVSGISSAERFTLWSVSALSPCCLGCYLFGSQERLTPNSCLFSPTTVLSGPSGARRMAR